MSGFISPGGLQGQTRPIRPSLPIDCALLQPPINLHGIPKTEEARKAWRNTVRTIKADLEGLAIGKSKYDPPTIVPTTIGLD